MTAAIVQPATPNCRFPQTGNSRLPIIREEEPATPDCQSVEALTGNPQLPVQSWDLWVICRRLTQLLCPNPDARAIHFAVAKELAIFSSKDRMFPTARTIGNQIGFELHAVRLALLDLEDMGLLVATSRHSGRSTEYCFAATVFEAPADSLKSAREAREEIMQQATSTRRGRSPLEKIARRAARSIVATSYLPAVTRILDDGECYEHALTISLRGRADRVLTGEDTHALDAVLGPEFRAAVESREELVAQPPVERGFGCSCRDVGCPKCCPE